MHPKYKRPALELILTTLHAGGKFENQNYYHSGGLHGVGASVVTALSSSLVAQVKRDGFHWEQRFARGKASRQAEESSARRAAAAPRITFTPDAQIFPNTTFKPAVIRERLEARSYLHRGLTLVFENEVDKQTETFHHDRGIAEYIEKLISEWRQAADRRAVLRRAQGWARSSNAHWRGPKRPTNASCPSSTASRRRRAARTRTV